MTDQTPLPPWQAYPATEPFWSGWRQGNSEGWLHEVWLPFWRSLDAKEREAFLLRHPPPDDDWRSYMLTYWS